MARGILRASQISTLGIEMALPAVAGYWGDQRWGTSPWLLIVGVICGFVISLYSIIKLTQRKP